MISDQAGLDRGYFDQPLTDIGSTISAQIPQ